MAEAAETSVNKTNHPEEQQSPHTWSTIDITMEKKLRKKMVVPEDKKGLIIGRKHSGLKDIADATKAYLFTEGNEIYVEGTVEQIKLAENLIQDKLACREKSRMVFMVPVTSIGVIIGARGSNLNRLKRRTSTRIRIDNEETGDLYRQIEIVGYPEDCEKAHSSIQTTILSCGDGRARREFGGGSDFACFNQDHFDTEFKLVECCNPPKQGNYIIGKLHEIKIQNNPIKHNNESKGNEDALSVIKKHLLPVLENVSSQKEEKKLLVDIWCHFGKVFFHNVQIEDFDGPITTKTIYERLGNNVPRVADICREYWKTTFVEGVCGEKISKANMEFFLRFKHTYWRYDYTFATPSGRNVRFKSWENLTTDEPPQEVKNLLSQVTVKDQENTLLSWLCYHSNTLAKCDLLVPTSQYDCRLKFRTGPRFVTSKSAEDKEEDETLSDYLSYCTLDNHQLNLPDPTDKSLPEGFFCLFYRAAQEDMYLSEAEDEDDQSFTLLFLDEEGWETDTAEKTQQKRTGIRVVMDSWSKVLLSDNFNWEPQEILDLLPAYMEFVETLQKNLFR